jgi:hypothetical protein
VEVRAGVGEPARLAVDHHVRQDQDVPIVGMVELVDDVRLRRAEAPRPLDELGGGEPLPARDEDLRLEEGVADGVELAWRQAREIDAVDLDAEALGEGMRDQHAPDATATSTCRRTGRMDA